MFFELFGPDFAHIRRQDSVRSDQPWSTFRRIVKRYNGDHHVMTLNCAEQFRAMAFAQLTYRGRLRDIEVCLASQAEKLWTGPAYVLRV
jgi:hypothetical protein